MLHYIDDQSISVVLNIGLMSNMSNGGKYEQDHSVNIVFC